MKKIILFSLPALFACGTDAPVQTEAFTGHEVTISRSAVCDNLDASVREEMDAGAYEKLCGEPKACKEIEREMVCEGDWCIIYHSCRMK
jgi:hypothetical protein